MSSALLNPTVLTLLLIDWATLESQFTFLLGKKESHEQTGGQFMALELVTLKENKDKNWLAIVVGHWGEDTWLIGLTILSVLNGVYRWSRCRFTWKHSSPSRSTLPDVSIPVDADYKVNEFSVWWWASSELFVSQSAKCIRLLRERGHQPFVLQIVLWVYFTLMGFVTCFQNDASLIQHWWEQLVVESTFSTWVPVGVNHGYFRKWASSEGSTPPAWLHVCIRRSIGFFRVSSSF